MDQVITVMQALGWPLLVLFLVIYFGPELKKRVQKDDISLKAGTSGVEVSIKAAAQFSAYAAAATVKSDAENSSTEKIDQSTEVLAQTGRKIQQLTDTVTRAVSPNNLRRMGGARILWVDDVPTNNRYERHALEALGLRFTLSESTEDALEQVRKGVTFDVVISDMGRPGDNRAGYTLLHRLRTLGSPAPFIIYSGSNRPEHKREALSEGAFGATGDPQELFQLVLSALQVPA